ncbi:tetratricopeptide repeat protein [Luteimonas salinilitoris]
MTRELFAPDGAAVALTPKAIDVLLQLIEHRGQILGKDALLASVWPGRVVEENNLTQLISALRRAFGTGAGDHRYIVTVPGRGYCFVATVEDEALPVPAAAAPPGADTGTTTQTSADRGAPTPAAPTRWRWLIRGALAVVLFAATLAAGIAWRGQMQGPVVATNAATATMTLAVLPFRAIGREGDGRDEMLELGMAETLIARLSRATSMRVLSLNSVQRFTGAKVDPLRAGRTLGADFVVEGSTQQRGNSIRVNARLLSLADGRTVWAGTFDQAPERVFTLQDVLAEAVISALSLEDTASARHSSPCDGSDARAYRAYLRGRYLIFRPDPRRLTEALAAFRQATDRDPACARAWAGAAFAYRALVITGERDPRAMFPLAKQAVTQALAIDPDSAEAYSSRGFIEFWYDWDWARAEASLRHAVSLDPNLAEAHFALAHLLNNIGRADEAASQARYAALLDPLSPLVNTLVSVFVGNAGHVDEARQRLEKVLQLEPDFWIAMVIRAGTALGRGDHAQAITDLRRARELSGDSSIVLSYLARAHVQAGDRGAAEQVLADLERRARTGYVPASSLAAVYSALGDRERALDMLERAYAERDVHMSFLLVDVRWLTLHQEPRFRALIRRMHLEDEEY